MVNLQLLAKLLSLASSPNDAEAAVAARKANAMVSAAGTTWEALLRAPVGVPRGDDAPDIATPEIDVKQQVRRAFIELGMEIVSGDQELRALWAIYHDHGYLSPAQRRPLFEAVRRKRAGR